MKTSHLLPEIDQILAVLLDRLPIILLQNLVGVYLRGSLALGDFIPEISDLDVLVVTGRPASDEEFANLREFHYELASSPNPFGRRMEVAYIDRIAMRRFTPGERHPTLGQGETLVRSEHRDNWILERWVVREHGVTLFGPEPKKLIEPISAEEICKAVVNRLPDWAEYARQTEYPDSEKTRVQAGYMVETMCRAMYALKHFTVCSKPVAVRWALETLPEPWRSTVVRSQVWRADRTIDISAVNEARDFVMWVAQRGRG